MRTIERDLDRILAHLPAPDRSDDLRPLMLLLDCLLLALIAKNVLTAEEVHLVRGKSRR